MSEQDISSSTTAFRLIGRRDRAEPWVSIGVVVVLALALRLPLLGVPSYPDEGGYLLVARHWHSGGPFLYGRFFVDRPPLLLAIFRLADAMGGLPALRLIGAGLVAVMVVGAGCAGWLIGSVRGARWAAVVAAALASSPLLGAAEVDGELLAAPFVVCACALVLAAHRQALTPARQAAYAALGGLAAVAAVLVKQNFVDAFAFAVVLLTASFLRQSLARPALARILVSFSGGAAIGALGAAAWAVVWGSGLADLWYALYGFRIQALIVIHDESVTPAVRLEALPVITVKSGMALLATVYVLSQRRALRQVDPLRAAVATMLAVAVLGIALSASFWNHALIQLVPALVLASACLASCSGRADRWARAAVGLVVVSAVLSVLAGAVPTQRESPEASGFETWLDQASLASDSLLVTYGHSDILEESGLRPAYRYLWTLPMRVLDPHQTKLRATLDGPHAPTWVAEWDDVGALATGSDAKLLSAIASHYRQVADICGHPVYLHDGLRRSVPASTPTCDNP